MKILFKRTLNSTAERTKTLKTNLKDEGRDNIVWIVDYLKHILEFLKGLCRD